MSTTPTTNLLELKGVHTHIGAYHILHGVDLAVPKGQLTICLLYTSPSPRDQRGSRMPSSA